jgi:hypothetical protein
MEPEDMPPRLAVQKAGALLTLAAAVALALIAVDVLRQRPEPGGPPEADES